MIDWKDFRVREPELARIGEKLLWLEKPEKGGLGYLATVDREGEPRVHPVSPVMIDGHLYAFILKRSPKKRDLLSNGKFAIHSFPDASLYTQTSFKDEEFFIRGRADHVMKPELRIRVAKACGDDPESGEIFELKIQNVMHKHRESGRAVYSKWRF